MQYLCRDNYLFTDTPEPEVCALLINTEVGRSKDTAIVRMMQVRLARQLVYPWSDNNACVGTLIEERCSVLELVWPTSKRGFDSHGKLLILEKWESGLIRQSWKLKNLQGFREFESHLLRQSPWRGGWEAESTRLLTERALIRLRGFESHPLRQ